MHVHTQSLLHTPEHQLFCTPEMTASKKQMTKEYEGKAYLQLDRDETRVK